MIYLCLKFPGDKRRMQLVITCHWPDLYDGDNPFFGLFISLLHPRPKY